MSINEGISFFMFDKIKIERYRDGCTVKIPPMLSSSQREYLMIGEQVTSDVLFTATPPQ